MRTVVCPTCGHPLPARLTITPEAAIVRDEWLTDGHRITTQKIRVIYFKKEGEYDKTRKVSPGCAPVPTLPENIQAHRRPKVPVLQKAAR